MDKLKCKIIKYLEDMPEDQKCMLSFFGELLDNGDKYLKSSKHSERARQEGNALFVQSNHDSEVHHKILQFYNESIAFAPDRSEELATAYGNKSALLRHIRKYAESIIEIDQALKITKSVPLKVKLLCRKADCCTALGLSENRNYLEKARFILAKSSDLEKVKENLMDQIVKTQSTIDANELDIPKENRNRIEASRIIADAEKVDPWSCVQIEFNEEYGRHLVAARDFEPGEVILVEKPYVKCLNGPMVYLYCSQCWKYLWTAVPCDGCTSRLFCSGECKLEALNEYHDLECSTSARMRDESLVQKNRLAPIFINLFFRALKESGSIEQLQKDVKLIDECTDKDKNLFLCNGKFKDYSFIYTLPFREDDDDLENWIGMACFAMMGLAKYSLIFGAHHDFSRIKKLVKDDSAVFAGALILKFCVAINSRKCIFYLPNPCEAEDTEKSNVQAKFRPGQMSASLSFARLGFFAMNGCVPNVKSFLTTDNRYVLYSMNPIQKGSPLIMSTRSIYEYASRSEREANHQKSYRRTYDCEACTEDWAEIIDDEEDMLMGSHESKGIIGDKLLKEIKFIEREIDTKALKPNFPDTNLLCKAKCVVSKSWRHFPMPSLMTFRAINAMVDLLEFFHKLQNWDVDKVGSCKL